MRALVIVALTAGLVFAPPATATPGDPPAERIQVEVGRVAPSDTLPDVYVFTGTGYLPSTPVQVSVNGVDTIQVISSSDGSFRAQVIVLGEQPTALAASGAGALGPRVVTAAVSPELTSQPVGPSAKDVPTRVYTNLLAGLAVVLLLVMLVVARQAIRRRPGTAP